VHTLFGLDEEPLVDESLTRILDAGRHMAAIRRLDPLLDYATRAAAAISGADGCILALVNAQGALIVRAQHGPLVPSASDPAWHDRMQHVLAGGQPVVVPAGDAGDHAEESVVYLPLASRGKVLGVLGLAFSGLAIDRPTEAMTFLAGQAAITIDNAILNDELQTYLAVHTQELVAANERLQAEIDERERVEEQLRKLSRAVEQSANSIVITDLDGRIEYVNPKFTDLTGYTFDEAIGQNPKFLQSGLTPPERYVELWNTIQAGREWRGEFVNRKKNGELYWEFASISPVRNAKGAITHYLAVKEDITERKRAEDAEREQRHLAEALRDTAAALTSTLDQDEVFDRILSNLNRVVPCDAASLLILDGSTMRIARSRGYSGDEPDFAPVALDDAPLIRQAVESGQPVVIADVQGRAEWRATDSTRWIRSHAVAPIQLHDQVFGALRLDSASPGFFTETYADRLQLFAGQAAIAIENARLFEYEQRQRHVEAMLREATAFVNGTLDVHEVLERIMNQIRAVVACDTVSVQQLKGDCLEIIACDGFDRPDEVIGQRFAIGQNELVNLLVTTRQPVHIEDTRTSPRLRRYREEYPDIAIATWLGIPLIARDEFIGQITLDRHSVKPYAQEEIDLAVAFANHAARALENARLHAELQRRAADLEESWTEAVEFNRVQSTFLSMVAHDIRSPLTTVTAALAMLEDGSFGSLTDEQQEWIGASLRAVEHVTRLTEDFFDLTRIELGKLSLYPQPVDPNTYLPQIYHVGRALPWPDDIEFTLDLAPDLPEVELDTTRIQQVIMNLLTNALKFTEKGTVTLYARPAEDGAALVIGVRDTGIGLASEDTRVVFDRFQQLGRAEARREGTGLGLAICRDLVELHSGTITVESVLGQGSDFWFVLPQRVPVTA
jgi:PAS domain S-box-containing protein